MKKIAVALARVLRESKLNRVEITSQTGIGATALSRYLSGKAIPSSSSLAKLMLMLPEKQALDLFQAYLKEIFPKKLVDKISISTHQPTQQSEEIKQEEELELEEELEELEDSLNILREFSIEKASVKKMVIGIAEAIQG